MRNEDGSGASGHDCCYDVPAIVQLSGLRVQQSVGLAERDRVPMDMDEGEVGSSLDTLNEKVHRGPPDAAHRCIA